ncbi:hypothetical protein E2C01_045028 [Portunus trituberculatus]|uniref:Uncharacterized protein n=1 Tax=Portunus trituberculatus TaxID=210409 RepID=A0A5B7G0P6_PORTR|nr:hypothetical protein [Portunus trituberculatus]
MEDVKRGQCHWHYSDREAARQQGQVATLYPDDPEALDGDTGLLSVALVTRTTAEGPLGILLDLYL